MSDPFIPKCDECARVCVATPATHYVQEHIHVTTCTSSVILNGLKVGYCATHAPYGARPIDIENTEVDVPVIVQGKD